MDTEPKPLSDCPPGDYLARLPYFRPEPLPVRVQVWSRMDGTERVTLVSLRKGSISQRYLTAEELAGAEFFPEVERGAEAQAPWQIADRLARHPINDLERPEIGQELLPHVQAGETYDTAALRTLAGSSPSEWQDDLREVQLGCKREAIRPPPQPAMKTKIQPSDMSAADLIKYLNGRRGWHGKQYRAICGEWLRKAEIKRQALRELAAESSSQNVQGDSQSPAKNL